MKYLFLIISIITLFSCNEKINKTKSHIGEISLKTCGPINFESMKVVLDARCNTCHTSHLAKGVNLLTYEGLKASSAKVEDEVKSGRMPKGFSFAKPEEDFLLSWISNGTPNEKSNLQSEQSCSGENKIPEIKPLVPTYESIRDRILLPKCISCHQSDKSADLYAFTSYRGTMFLTEIFDLENPENSRIIKDVTQEGKDMMPPKKSGIERLTAEEVKVMVEWIRAGLPEK